MELRGLRNKRGARLPHLLAMLALLIALISSSGLDVAAQEIDGTPGAEPATTEPITPEPTEDAPAVTETPTEIATEISTAEPTEMPPVFVPDTPTVEATESPTVTPSPTVTAQDPGLAADDPQSAVVHFTATIGTSDGPRLAGVCFRVVNPSYGFSEAYGCTDANGEVTVQTSTSFTGDKGFNITITTPVGYEEVDSLLRFLSAGITNTVSVTFTPLAPVTETLKAVDSTTGDPVAGACWSYYENQNHGTPGDLAIGPNCDDDNDGTVTITDIPLKAYCVIVTAPSGYTVVGSTTICTEAAQRPTDITKAFSVSEVVGNGSLQLTFLAPWGAPVEGVCGQASLLVSGTPFTVGSACSNADGHATITGLLDGSYTLSAMTWPNFWERFSPASFTIIDGNTASVEITVDPVPSENGRFTTVFAYGPTTVGGSCWDIATGLDASAPGYYQIAAPVCDTDGDGEVVLTNIPAGPYCFTLTPPPGYYRTDGRYGFCFNESNGQGFHLTVGVLQIPATPTTTPSPTPTPTTPVPTPTPVPNEPNGNVAVINCADDHETFADGSPNYQLCQSAGAGLRFAVIQNGSQVTTIITGADGTAVLNLIDRAPYTLQYLDGNVSPYIPAPGQSTLLRYDSQQRFFFTRDPASDHTLTFTATIKGYNDGFAAVTPLGGACAKVLGQDNVEYLPEICDTDGDGVIVIGQLAPRYDGVGSLFYRMVMTQPPAGYDIKPLNGFISDPNHPNDVVATASYATNTLRIQVVDENGDPVLGYCLRGDNTIYDGGTHCDGPNPYTFHTDDPVDGTITFSGLVPGVNHTFESFPTTPGWTPDTNVATYATTSSVFTDVVYRVHRYGTSAANQAEVHVTLALQDLGPGYDYNEQGVADICYRISGYLGNPAGGACSSGSGEILFRNVPQGAYELVLNWNNSYCASVPSSVPFSVAAADLGGIVDVAIEVTGCATKKLGGGTCNVYRNAPGRTVDLYYGTLTGPGGATVLETTQLSETIPSILWSALLGASNPDPTHITSATLAPWAEPYYYDSAATDWSRRPDWDGNAYQLMLDAYNGTGGDYTLGARINHGSYLLDSGIAVGFEFTDSTTDWSKYPECSTDSAEVVILVTYQSTVNLYELNAVENAPVTPAPTPIPSPEPLCTTTVTRDDIVAYYGTATLPGRTEYNLALSNHIPAALSQAIADSSPPQSVAGNISGWIGSGIDAETWYAANPEGIDAEANLRSQLSNSGATPGDPVDRGTATYTYTNYRYLDITDLPEGCSPNLPGDEIQPAFSVLIPVTQETVVTVHYYEMNATLDGAGSPTATATSPIPTSTAIPSPTKSAPSPTTTASSSAPAPGSNPLDVREFPNTGTGPSLTTRDRLLLFLLTLVFALAIIATILIPRRKP